MYRAEEDQEAQYHDHFVALASILVNGEIFAFQKR
jgi:hypothetical protein